MKSRLRIESAAGAEDAAPPSSDQPTVYVIDDDISVRESLGNLMRSVGLHAHLFSSAQDFKRFSRPAGPQCLVLDVRLPRTSGLDLQAELTAAGDRIPIVFITGHADVPMSVRAMKGGAVEFLQKPFREQELLDAIHLALMHGKPSDPGIQAISGFDATPPLPASAAQKPPESTGEVSPRPAIARNIQMGRAIFSWSQEDLGNQCELHRTHISALEREELSVGVDTLDRIAGAFGVPPHVLLMPPAEVQSVLLESFNGTGRSTRQT